MKEYYSKVFRAIFIILILLAITRFFIISPGKISGNSMEPNYHEKQTVFINKIIYLFKKPERFDVVEMVEPRTNKIMIKRIIGLPGETLTIKNGRVFIQAKQGSPLIPLSESYLSQNIQTTGADAETVSVLGSDSYYMLGDKREVSTDSRIYGPINRKDILGKIMKF